MRSPEKPYQAIPWQSRLLRKTAGFAVTLILPAEVISSEEGLPTVRKQAKKGWGVKLYSTHPTQGEIPRQLAMIGRDPILRDRELLVPETLEHYAPWHSNKGGWVRIAVCPIMTWDSMRYFATPPNKEDKKQLAKYEEKKALAKQILEEAGKQYIEYLKSLAEDDPRRKQLDECKSDLMKAGQKGLSKILIDGQVQTLRQGNTILGYVQGGRRPYLGTITPAISTLIKATNEADVTNYTLAPMGVEIEGVEDYGNPAVTGYNYGKRYIFRVGRAYTSKEFQEEARHRKLTLDQLAREELSLVIPPYYQSSKKP